jgi:biopolymer transport protein ExbD
MIIGGGTVLITGILHVTTLGGDGMDTIIMLTILVIIMVGIPTITDITTITTPDAIMTVAQQRSTEVIAQALSAERDLQQIVNNDLQRTVRQA